MSQEFRSGLCDCMSDFPSCAYTFFCLPCASASNMTAARGGNCLAWLLCSVAPVTTFGYHIMSRYVIRESYGIQGDIVDDCVKTTFCTLCSECQLQREVKERGPCKQTMN